MVRPQTAILVLPLCIGLLTVLMVWSPYTWTDILTQANVHAPISGALAPDFRLPPLNPREHSGRLSTYQHNVVLLTFWATWCGPCKKELPALQELSIRYKNEGFRVVAVSIDQDGAIATNPFATILGLTFPILHDQDGSIAQQYRVQAVPQNFLIDRQGRILWKHPGAIDWTAEKEAELQRILASKPS